MTWRGDIQPSEILDFEFNTFDKASSAPITLAGSPVVKVYKDNSTSTEVTTGVTLTVDFDTLTGNHNVRIDASADTSFYAAGSNYKVKLTAGTVDGVSVAGVLIAEFSIQHRAPRRPLVLNVLAKYATATDFYIQVPKAGGAGFALTADYTPAAADFQVSIDGAAQANITTTPSFVNGQLKVPMGTAQLTGKVITVTLADAAPKAVDDILIRIETYGNASAQYQGDFSAADQAFPTNFATLVIDGAGRVDLSKVAGTAQTAGDIYGLFTATLAEATSVPGATASMVAKLAWLFALLLNKMTSDGTTEHLRNHADNADLGTRAVSDASGTTTQANWV